MRLLILGATGRIGSLALQRALELDHQVSALVRDPSKLEPRSGLTIVAGGLDDPDAITSALGEAEAVIAAVGPRSNTMEDELALETGMRHLVSAMRVAGITRLVALSGAGIEVPGDRKPWLDRLASRVVRVAARHVVGAKQREFDIFAATDLAWTALRPPLVTDGPAQGYRLDARLQPGARVRRADVAAALVDQVSDARFQRAAPFVLPPA